jgi:hypothetical protein
MGERAAEPAARLNGEDVLGGEPLPGERRHVDRLPVDRGKPRDIAKVAVDLVEAGEPLRAAVEIDAIYSHGGRFSPDLR